MGRGWRPVLVGGAVAAATFALAQAEVFAPSGSAEEGSSGDATRGEALFAEECASCHGSGGTGGVGPRLAGSGVSASQVTDAVRQGRGIMPAGLVTGEDEADVVAYVVSIAAPVD